MSPDALDGRGPDAIEDQMASQVAGIMSAARQAAASLQAEVERASTERAAQIETAAARRAHEVRMGAEAEAERLHSQTRAAAQQYVTASRRLVDEFAKERMRRIAEIGDRLAEQSEALAERFAHSGEVARKLDELRAALGTACERIAAEAAVEPPAPPELARPSAIAGAPPMADEDQSRLVDAAQELRPQLTLEARLARATYREPRHAVDADRLSPAAAAEVPADET